jgi:hypothetical protein
MACAAEWQQVLRMLSEQRDAGRGRRRWFPIDRTTGKAPLAVPSYYGLRWGALEQEATNALLQMAGPLDRAFSMPGVYALLGDGCIQYIGQSWDLASRLDQHARKGFRLASAVPVAFKARVCAERHLLDLLVPPHNRDGRTKRLRAWRNLRQVA